VAQQEWLTPLHLGCAGIEKHLRLALHIAHLQGVHGPIQAALVPPPQLRHQFEHHIAGLGRQIRP
jgi:hypothetical protein